MSDRYERARARIVAYVEGRRAGTERLKTTLRGVSSPADYDRIVAGHEGAIAALELALQIMDEADDRAEVGR